MTAPNVITRDEFERQADDVKAALSEVKNLGGQINAVLELLQNMPAAKKVGTMAPDSGADHPEATSFGDYLVAVMNGNETRLKSVYKTRRGKALGTTDGPGAGWLTPPEYSTEIRTIAAEQSPILSLVERVDVGMAMATGYPALDNFVVPSAGAGETSGAAGVKTSARVEGGTYTESEPSFVELDYRVREHGGTTVVNNELPRFSPFAIEQLLRRLFSISVSSRKEFMILRGNGTTQYLGIMNSPVAIPISPDTNSVFVYADMLEMWSRFKKVAKDPIWLAHPGMIVDIGQFQIGTNGAGVPTQVGTPGMVTQMPGTPYPIRYSEHLPQANSSGCVMLADFGAYVMFESGELEIAFSEHAAFAQNKGTWRWTDYSDGMPWLKNKITLADPQGGYTVSPFIYFND